MKTVLKTAIVAMLIAVASLLPAKKGSAQSGLRQVPLGYCVLTSPAAATKLSSCSGGIPAGTTYAVICSYIQGVVWRDDGVAPTATAGSGGQGLAANQCLPYNGTFTALQFIQQISGAILGVSFYR